jgi:group I intron endonuclease
MFFQNFDTNLQPILLIGGGFDIFKNQPDLVIQGVYMAVCLDNEKIYIGSSNDFKRRIKKEHIKKLDKGIHENKFFQRNYDKYGKYFWYLLEKVDNEDDQFDREQFYLDNTLCCNPSVGFNLSPFAKKPPSGRNIGALSEDQKINLVVKRRGHSNPFVIKDPNGNLHSFICSITTFANNHDLSPSKLAMVLQGNVPHHRQWTLPGVKIEPKKVFSLKSPIGEIVSFDNKMRFCQANGFSEASLLKVLSGEHKQVKGWTLPDMEILPRELLDPFGNLHKFFSIRSFAEEYGLPQNRVSDVLLGIKNNILGWTKPGVSLKPIELFTLISPDGEEIHFSNKSEFRRVHNLSEWKMDRILNGTVSSADGWSLKK